MYCVKRLIFFHLKYHKKVKKVIKKNLLNEYKWYKISSINHTRAAIAGREYIYNSLINKDTLEIGLRCVHDFILNLFLNHIDVLHFVKLWKLNFFYWFPTLPILIAEMKMKENWAKNCKEEARRGAAVWSLKWSLILQLIILKLADSSCFVNTFKTSINLILGESFKLLETFGHKLKRKGKNTSNVFFYWYSVIKF